MHSRIVSLFLISICCYGLHAQQLPPSIIWQKCLGGTRDDQALSIVRATDGGYIVAGSSKSNDGDITGHHGSTDSTDAWIVKVDVNGNIQWQKSLGGSGKDEIDHIINTNDGGYIGIGSTTSNDGDVSGYHGATHLWKDIWVVKLDRHGAMLWQKCLGGSLDDVGSSIRQTADSGYIISANVRSRDGDVSGNLGSDYVAWVAKLDLNGNIQMNHSYNCTGTSDAYDAIQLASGEYLIATDATVADKDFTGAGSANPQNAYLLKVDASGNVLTLIWPGQRSACYGFQKMDEAHYFLLTDLSNCYPSNPNFGFAISNYDTSLTALGYKENFSYCPNSSVYGYKANGPGSMALLSDGTGVTAGATSDPAVAANHGGYNDGFLSNFYPATWRKCYGGSGIDQFQGIVADDDHTFVTSGYTNSNDGDVSGNHGGYDFWIVRLGKTNTIKGAVYLDYNLNGVKDAAEPFVNNVLIQSSEGSTSFASPTYNGIFYNSVDTGAYTTKVLSPSAYYTPVPATASSVFSTYNNTDSLSFALQPIPGKRDYHLNLYAYTAVRPGFNATFQLQYVNAGTDTLVDRPVKLIKDHRLLFVSALPAEDAVSGDTIIWNIHHLSPRDTGIITVQLQVAMPPAANLGDTLLSTAVIDSTGDLNPADNLAVLRELVTSSFDPNDKQESNGGRVPAADLGRGKSLLYTIRFQNTGTDTAFNITVRDTLSNKVDPASLEMVAVSHPYHLAIKNGNILEWTFSNILLPDSTHHEAASHGYVVYRIKAAAGVAVGDSIRNKASIYFDFNAPVATNTQLTLVSDVTVLLPPAPAISGLLVEYCSSLAAPKIRITNIPAPSYQAAVTVKVDGIVTTVAADSSFFLRTDTLAAGVHALWVVFRNAAGGDSTEWTFKIDVAATPVADLNSSITNVVSLSQQVVLTATNTSGGGSGPLFTFARDRTFTNILQAEGAMNTFNLDPSTLQIGNNTLYVRMKTSESCYTQQTGVDSIVIVRSPVTGLVDVDYPGQVINISPNPFTSFIYISGLQPAKNYSVSLVNSNGQVVLRKQISGQQEATLNGGALPKGIFLLRVFDEKKKRLIGSAKLLSLGE